MSLGAALLVVAAAILCLRLGWRSSGRLVAAGWILGLGALTVLTIQWGVWGLSAGSLVAMSCALGILAADAIRSKPARRPVAALATVTPPRWRAEGLARRTAVFALVIPIGFAATTVLALGAEAMARRAGWAEADRFVLALMLQPLAWAILASLQMLHDNPRGMLRPTLVCAIAGAALWTL